MNKTKLFLLSILFVASRAMAQYNHLPEIPANTYNVKDFGATGDNKTLNTDAIQRALDKAKSTGGTVQIPAGEYLCGPLNLYSKTNLQIDKGAVLRLINDIKTFPSTNGRYLNFINISKCADIKVSGGGIIDGQGEIWWKGVEDKSLSLRRPQMFYIEGCQRIEISGITTLNPPNTHISLKNCTDVYIHDITIQAPANSHNTDGINISARNTTIQHCTINTGDDNIAINFGNRDQAASDPEIQNMVVKDCTFGCGHGLSIGSFTSGHLNNLLVTNCAFDGTTSAIRIKTARGRGGVIDNIRYEDITIKNSRYPIFVSEYYPKEPKTPEEDAATAVGDHCPVYKNISFKNITATNSQEAMLIWGVPESPIQHLRFENVKILAKNGAKIYNAAQVEFINSTIRATSGDQLKVYRAAVSGLN